MLKTVLLRLKDVEAACGIKKSAIYAKIKTGDFPSGVMLGPKSRAWRSDDVEAWIESRPKVKITTEPCGVTL